MRLVHTSFLYAALLLGLAFGCSSDSDSAEGDTNTATMNTATTNAGTVNTASSSATMTSTTTSANTTTSAGTGSSTTGGPGNVPMDGSAESISAFLEAEGYKDTGWVSVHDAPVPATVGSPHGTVRIYLSPALAAFRETNPDVLEEPAVPGAMAVKEFYDDASAIVGKAAIFYPANDVVYYCYGAEGRCTSGRPATTIDAPEWGDEDAAEVSQCDGCHSGLVFTELP